MLYAQNSFNTRPCPTHRQRRSLRRVGGGLGDQCNRNRGLQLSSLLHVLFHGDLGGDFSRGQMDWAQVTFDKGATAEQRQALGEIIGHVFPVKWKSLQIAEGNIDTWAFDKDHAHATLNGGKTAEIKLARFQGMTDEPAVLTNVKYWGTPRNDGFVMMPNEIETYREGPKPYEFKGTNGFMLTFDMTSKDVPAAKGSSMNY